MQQPFLSSPGRKQIPNDKCTEDTRESAVLLRGADDAFASKDSRLIYVGAAYKSYLDQVEREHKKPQKFCNNRVTTSSYTLNPFSLKFILWKNLFEQMYRAANIYFLCIALLQLVPGLSPTGTYTTIGPLSFVMMLSLLKDGFEDYKRHMADREVNSRRVNAYRYGVGWANIKWSEVAVGDILMIRNKMSFPADMILLSSSEPEGVVCIETSSLDGETNLKIRKANSIAYHAFSSDYIEKFSAVVESELPNNRIETFYGTIALDPTCALPNERAFIDDVAIAIESPSNLIISQGSSSAPGDTKTRRRGPVSVDSMLLRGAQLRNTSYAFGLVVFTGLDTKLMKNSLPKRLKRSNVDEITNNQVLYVFLLQLIFCLVCCIGLLFVTPSMNKHWYVSSTTDDLSVFWIAVQGFGTFLILFNNLIPISLYVCIELVKLVQAYMINKDLNIYYEPADQPAIARTSALNEELGQISYLFSDKTGTLTCNKMEFIRFCCADKNGSRAISYGTGTTDIAAAVAQKKGLAIPTDDRPAGYKGFYDPRLTLNGWKGEENNKQLEMFLLHLAICHTVVIEDDDGRRSYQASSPDELTLVKGARELGVSFVDRTENSITIGVCGEKRVYTLMQVIEFDSSRKRMSVIVKDLNGQLLLLCKGADNVIYERLRYISPNTDGSQDQSAGQLELRTSIEQLLTSYGSEGLRTLVMAYAELDQAVYNEWAARYEEAHCAIISRDEKIAAVGGEIERDLILLGATAIEDKLQDGVPEAIEQLANAGINIWVLTGDKQETAINIGYACSLLDNAMTLITFDDIPPKMLPTRMHEILMEARDSRTYANAADIGLVIQGAMLRFVMEGNKDGFFEERTSDTLPKEVIDYRQLKLDFIDLAIMCKTVICCRVSPLQKSEVVNLVKRHVPLARTLAIGDGANDVSMIQAADVGVGISGYEGLQAARAADYAIAQFRFLSDLLLVHGRYNYRRTTRMILYSFYKNIAMYLSQMWYCFFNAFSGRSLVDNWALAVYNVCFTALPIMVVAVFDKDVARRRVIGSQQFPELYGDGPFLRLFNRRTFWVYVTNAIFHSVLGFMITFFCFQSPVSGHGYGSSSSGLGIASYTVVLTIVTCKVSLETNSWTILHVLIMAGSIAMWFIFLAVYNYFFMFFQYKDFADWYGAPAIYLQTVTFWLLIPLVAVAANMRDFVYKYYQRRFVVSELSHAVQVMEAEYKNEPSDFTRESFKPEFKRLLGRVRTLKPKVGAKNFLPRPPTTGFNFSQNKGESFFMKLRAVRNAVNKIAARVKRKRNDSEVTTDSRFSARVLDSLDSLPAHFRHLNLGMVTRSDSSATSNSQVDPRAIARTKSESFGTTEGIDEVAASSHNSATALPSNP